MRLTVGSQQASDGPFDVVYTGRSRNNHTTISAHKLIYGKTPTQSESKRVLRYENLRPITNFQVVSGGRIVVLSVGSTLMVGYVADGPTTPFTDSHYVWYELASPCAITSIDARVVDHEGKAKSKDTSLENPLINVLVGDEMGVVFAHYDLLNKLIRLAPRGGSLSNKSIMPQKLHWHRQAVRSARWSPDGESINVPCFLDHKILTVYRQLRHLWRDRDRLGLVAAQHWPSTVSSSSVRCN